MHPKKKKNWDVEIPQPKQGGFISIYKPHGKEKREEGNQIGSCYWETIEQEGG